MVKKILFTLAILCALTNDVSAQILKNRWVFNPQVTAFNLGSTRTRDTGNDTFDLGLKVEAGNFIADNLAVLVGLGGDLAWNKEYKNNRVDVLGGLRYYTLTTMFIGVNMGYTHEWTKNQGESTKKRDYLYVGAELGYAIFLTQNISLDPALYWKHSFTDQYDQYGLKMGFSVYF